MDNYKTVIDALRDPMIVANERRVIVHANAAAHALLGWQPPGLVGKELTVLVPARLQRMHEELFERHLATGAALPGRSFLIKALRRDGSELDLEVCPSTLSTEQGERLAIGSLRDVADRAELVRQRRTARMLRATARLAMELTGNPDPTSVIQSAAATLLRSFEASLARIWVQDRHTGQLCIGANVSHGDAGSLALGDSKIDARKVASVAATGKPFFGRSLAEEGELDRDALAAARITSAAILPLTVGGELRGVMTAFFPAVLDDDLGRALETFGALLAAALNDALFREVEKAARLRFEDFVNGINHGIVWEADAVSLRMTFVSAKAEKILGYPLGAWYREDAFWLNHIHPEDRERVAAALRDVVRNDRDLGFEHRFLRADGTVLWFHTGARLARQGPGAGRVVHALSSDITHVKAAEAKVAASRSQLAAILHSVRDGITATDPAGHVLFANDAAAKIAGFNGWETMTKAGATDVLRGRELRDTRGQIIARDQLPAATAMRTGKPCETLVQTRDPVALSVEWWVVSAIPLVDVTGRVEMTINLLHDVTESERDERASKLQAEASAVLGSSIDYEETLSNVARLVVPRFADWCAVDLAEGADHGLRQLAVQHSDPAKAHLAQELAKRHPADPSALEGAANVIRTGQPVLHKRIDDELLAATSRDAVYLEILRKLGMRSAMIVPLTARGRTFGAITFIAAESGRMYDEGDLAIARELAARAAYAVDNARLYAQAERSRQQAEQASRLTDEFLATVSHELRTPLSAILGWASLLKKDKCPDQAAVRSAIEIIERNARSQLRLIDDILDVSSIIRGQLRVVTEPVDLEAIARETLDVVAPAATAKHLRLELEACDGPFMLVADPDRLRQILWNLLSNAVKFTPKNGYVWLRLGHASGSLVIEVQDTGKGIAPDFLPHAFERFRQADASTTRSCPGLGLGLAIVRHVAEMHGGTVVAESEGLGKGATFRVTLPVKPFTTTIPAEEPAAGDRITPVPLSIHPMSRALSGRRLLVVEDEADSRALIKVVLASEGAKVETAGSASDALSVLPSFMPDVLVSDIGMPDHDGYWLLREARDLMPELPAIALTAFTRREDAAKARAAGFDEHVGKPVDPARLVETLSSLCRRRCSRTMDDLPHSLRGSVISR
ncbi:MAG: PAS domain S-box protein [Polyangiaceae bacterium]|nr:PAS domain S-box protein [Polyangiaceae bacterium]